MNHASTQVGYESVHTLAQKPSRFRCGLSLAHHDRPHRPPRPPIGDRAMTDAERQPKHRERLRQENPRPPNDRQRLAEAEQENEVAVREQVAALKRQTGTVKAPAAKPRATVQAPDESAEVARLKAQIARLRKRVANLQLEARMAQEFYGGQRLRQGIMSHAVYGKIMRCLHPDHQPTPEQRQDACGLFSEWRQANTRATK
jgi:hypothetical protein